MSLDLILRQKSMDNPSIRQILAENCRRLSVLNAPCDPIIGDADDPARFRFFVKGIASSPLWLPKTMADLPLVMNLMSAASVDVFIRRNLKMTPSPETRNDVCREFMLTRCRFDFPFWAASCVRIKDKAGGAAIPFILNYPQRQLVALFDRLRSDGKPVHVIMLKARQWGGSTCVQFYMVWLQLFHQTGLNSILIAHNRTCAESIKERLHDAFLQHPSWWPGDKFPASPKSGSRLFNCLMKDRNCKTFVASAECPDACRGIDLSLIHCSEVAFWNDSTRTSPESVVKAAFAGVIDSPDSMIILESTANGRNNYFFREYRDASGGVSRFTPFFMPWFKSPLYSREIDDPHAFVSSLLRNRKKIASAPRTPSGAYLWKLWEMGASLEAIAWYVDKRREFRLSRQMSDEFPSSPDEAFRVTERSLISRSLLRKMEKQCHPAKVAGEILKSPVPVFDPYQNPAKGPLANLVFSDSGSGHLRIWEQRALPEFGHHYADRYLVVAVLGVSPRECHAVTVFDRLTGSPGIHFKVVAQCCRASGINEFAWDAARVAGYYDNAALVFASRLSPDVNVNACEISSIPDSLLSEIRGCYQDYFRHPENPYDLQLKLDRTEMVKSIRMLASFIRRNAYLERDPEIPALISNLKLTQSLFPSLLLTRAIALQIHPHLPKPRYKPLPTIHSPRF